MRRALRPLAIVAAVAAVGAADAAAATKSLSGTYVTTVKTAGTLDGTYSIYFTPGHFVLHAPYNLVGHGTYSISGTRITLHGPGSACTTPGIYQYSLSGSYLTFHKISDRCPRAAVLTAHAMKRR
jgi:hypothetical protein